MTALHQDIEIASSSTRPRGESTSAEPSPLPRDDSGATIGSAADVLYPPDEPTSPMELGVPDTHPMRWTMFNVIIPLLLLAAVIALVIALGEVEAPKRPPADRTLAGRLRSLPAVRVVPIQSLKETNQPLRLKADGVVVPYREVVLATEVNGRVIEKSPRCEAGRFVTEGTELMKIDPTDYDFEVQRLRRLQEQEYVALGEVDQEMVNARRSMEIADADIQLQQREVKRLESLPDQFASRGEIDQARRALLQAEQQRVNYQNQLELLQKRRARLEAAERLAATQLMAAEVDLQRTVITAPISGVIVMENAELNTFVARGSAVVTMEDTAKVEVAAKLRSDQLYWVLNQADPDISDVLLTDPAATTGEFEAEAVGGYQLPPTPVRVIYQVAGRDDLRYVWQGMLIGYDGIGLDQQTRTVPVRVLVDRPREFTLERQNGGGVIEAQSRVANGPSALVRGMFVNLQLELRPAMSLVVVPAEALRPGNRVWEFTADPSVLDPKREDAQGNGGDQAGADAVTENSAMRTSAQEPIVAPEDEFDADAWVAGQLSVRGDIRAIDWIDGEGVISDAELDSSMHDDRISVSGRRWICEVAAGTLASDSFVVVSPLGSVNDRGQPVRAPVSQLTPPK